MTKGELIKTFSEQNEISIEEATTIVSIFFNSIAEYLIADKRIELRGFGSFRLNHYEGYMGRNPKTGGKVYVPAKKMPYFRAGKELKEYLNDKL